MESLTLINPMYLIVMVLSMLGYVTKKYYEAVTKCVRKHEEFEFRKFFNQQLIASTLLTFITGTIYTLTIDHGTDHEFTELGAAAVSAGIFAGHSVLHGAIKTKANLKTSKEEGDE